MESRPRILLLDDEPDQLAMYREILAQLPSQPKIRTVNNGPQAIALLEAEPCRVFICDLNETENLERQTCNHATQIGS